jgi:DNA-binding NtrC family response regulator
MSSTPNFHLLVIDDDPLIIDSLRLVLPAHWKLTSSPDARHIEGKMNIHAAFIDMHLTKSAAAEGPEIIAKISAENPKIEIVAMSGDKSMDLMESCLDKGAKKFLFKPLMADEVLATLEKIEALWLMRVMESRTHGRADQLIGTSPALEKVRATTASLRGEPGPILIQGETGTGKEVIAQLLNAQELNRNFVAVNVAGIPENLFESEMFGHVKGAFTGADSLKVGLAEAAHGGDLFLDEIEAMPHTQQVKLLRFLETGELRKVGAKDSTHVKTRVIVATNQKLEVLVKEGKFREDLLFRLSGKKIELPPLRERKNDIRELAPHFLSLLKPRTNKTFSPEALEALQNYSWPGNVRELKRICEQLALSSPLPILRAEDVRRLLGSLGENPVDRGNHQLDFKMGLGALVENFEASVIRDVFKLGNDVEQAADILQISRSSLYKKLKDYNIEVKG